jgi:hypothetical protein
LAFQAESIQVASATDSENVQISAANRLVHAILIVPLAAIHFNYRLCRTENGAADIALSFIDEKDMKHFHCVCKKVDVSNKVPNVCAIF